MRKKLKDLAKLVQGEVSGSPELSIKGVAPIELAGEGDLTFALDDKSFPAADSSKASAIIAPLRSKPEKPAILVKDPRLAMAKVLELFRPEKKIAKGVHKTAVVAKNSDLGKDSSVGAYAVIGENVKIGPRTVVHPGAKIGDSSKIGEDCVIYPNAVIYDGVRIGNRVMIHAGAAIGVDGFGFAQDAGKHIKIPQIGGVEIEDDVEIYANTCVARGTMGTTLIKRGTKIDNLTHIAHNCVIGEDCAITALVGFAGSVTFGDHVYVGGQAGFQGHISVGDNTVVMAKAGVTKDIPKDSVISGFPAHEHKKELEIQALLRRLPELIKKILK